MLRRAALLTLLLAGIAVAPASAGTTTPNLRQLKAAGLRVSWPLHGTKPAILAPGTKLTVVVRRVAGRTAPPVLLALVRTDGGRKRVAGTRLRSGSFTVHVPAGRGHAYVLTLEAGGLRYASRFDATPAEGPPTVAPGGPAGPSGPSGAGGTATGGGSTGSSGTTGSTGTTTSPPAAPGSGGGSTPEDGCDPNGTTAATISIDQTSTTAGGRVPYHVTNTGTGCLVAGEGNAWEQYLDGRWQSIQPEPAQAVPAIAEIIPPGGRMDGTATAGQNFRPGHYRIVKSLSADKGSGSVTLYAELDVTG